jgi:serine/threonine protein kinase
VRFCSNCGAEVQDEARFCPSCGTVMPVTTTPSADPYLGRTLDGKFLIQELLGVGGMGRVYKAVQLSLDKTLCVKVLRTSMMQDETLVRRFQREARAASRLNHPNSITVIDFGQAKEDGSLYLAMEYVPGKDLNKLTQQEWPMAEERVVHIMDQVLSALADAHAAGIIHRDLKPENIMVSDLRGTKDFVKVLDFGIAKIQESAAPEPGITQVGMVCGTPEYMSPEQARGEELDSRSDVYAAGVILYQMVTGRLPFIAPTAMGIVTKHLVEPPLPPSQVEGVRVSPALEAVILKAMSKDRNGRQPAALALQQELNAVLSLKVAPAQEKPLGSDLFDEARSESGQSASAGNPQPPALSVSDSVLLAQKQLRSAKKRRRTATVAIFSFVLLCGGAGAYFLWWVPSQAQTSLPDAGVAEKTLDASPSVLAGADAGTAATVDGESGEETGPLEKPVLVQEEISEAAKLHYQAGKELLAQGKAEQALPLFEKAVMKSPNFPLAYYSLGVSYMRLGNIPKAKQNFRLYLEKAPSAENRKDIEDLLNTL